MFTLCCGLGKFFMFDPIVFILNRPTTNHFYSYNNSTSSKLCKLSLVITNKHSTAHINHRGVVTKTRSEIRQLQTSSTPNLAAKAGNSWRFVINTTIFVHSSVKNWYFLKICYNRNVVSTARSLLDRSDHFERRDQQTSSIRNGLKDCQHVLVCNKKTCQRVQLSNFF